MRCRTSHDRQRLEWENAKIDHLRADCRKAYGSLFPDVVELVEVGVGVLLLGQLHCRLRRGQVDPPEEAIPQLFYTKDSGQHDHSGTTETVK